MSDNEYGDIVDRSWDDIPEPEVLPVGSYRLRCINAKFMPGTGDKSDVAMFVYSPTEAMDDVDADALEALGDYDIAANRVFTRLYLETGRDYDVVRKHLGKHGVDTQGHTIGETLTSAKGSEVIAYLDQRTYDNAAGEPVLDNEAKSFAAVD